MVALADLPDRFDACQSMADPPLLLVDHPEIGRCMARERVGMAGVYELRNDAGQVRFYRSDGDLVADCTDAVTADLMEALGRSRSWVNAYTFKQWRVARGFRDDLPKGAVKTVDGVGPTPETRGKLKACVVDRLHRQGKLDADQLLAAEEIQAISEALSIIQSPVVIDGVRVQTSARSRTLLDNLSGALETAWRRRYRPFMARWYVGVRPGRKPTVGEVVIAVVVDNVGVAYLDRVHGHRKGTATKVLARALREYAAAMPASRI